MSDADQNVFDGSLSLGGHMVPNAVLSKQCFNCTSTETPMQGWDGGVLVSLICELRMCAAYTV